MENLAALKAEINNLKSRLSEQEQELKQLKALNKWYEEQLKIKAREKFGKSSEKSDSNQLSLFDFGLFNEAETFRTMSMDEPAQEVVIKAHKRKRKPRGSKYENLSVEVIEYKLPHDEAVCDVCGESLVEMKKEIRKELKVVPAKISIVEHVTYVYSCRNCDKNGEAGFIKKAPSPKALLPKSLVSSGLMAQIIDDKFNRSLPLYRQEQNFKQYDINISRQDMSNWIIKGSKLLNPLYKKLISQMLEEDILHADETTLEVIHEPGREASTKSYMWVYRTSKYHKHPVIIYNYSMGRSGEFAKQFLKNWKGLYLQCDGYSGYKKLEDITLCGCLVHANRKFKDVLTANPKKEEAAKCIAYINKLFDIEAKADKEELTVEARLKVRNEKSKEIFDEFYHYLEEISPKNLPQSLLGKAITYAKNQKEYLGAFMKDARIQLSNNLAEQSIKPFVLGRKNWLFSNTPSGAESSAVLYSIVQTALANDLKPYYYLEYVFSQLQNEPDMNTKKLLPWSENIPDICKKDKKQS